MKKDDAPVADGAGRFCTTRWSAALLSAQSQVSGSQDAVAELCRIYWHPVYAFVRRRGYNPDDAQDLTQGFLLHLLENKALRQVNPAKGKFRSFLAASLQTQFRLKRQPARSFGQFGKDFIDFGTGTVQHAAGSLRMPSRPRYDQEFAANSVVNEDLKVVGTDRLYVCDMSVMPISTAANPVRTLVALALRLSRHLG